jgi:hypothetical protein
MESVRRTEHLGISNVSYFIILIALPHPRFAYRRAGYSLSCQNLPLRIDKVRFTLLFFSVCPFYCFVSCLSSINSIRVKVSNECFTTFLAILAYMQHCCNCTELVATNYGKTCEDMHKLALVAGMATIKNGAISVKQIA